MPLLKILYQDQDLVVVHKPAGMLVHRSMIDRHERIFLMQVLRDQIGQHVFPVHRLDKPTSGIMVFALSSEIAKILGEQFAEHQVDKHYLAVVRGYSPEHLLIDYPLKEQLDKKTDRLAQSNKAAQAAITVLSRLATVELPHPVGRYEQARFSLVKLSPKTGRKHQLRRHMAHIRHPIIGDTTHGDGTQNKFARSILDFHSLALIAFEINLKHPITHKQLSIKSAPDETLAQLLTHFEGAHTTNIMRTSCAG